MFHDELRPVAVQQVVAVPEARSGDEQVGGRGLFLRAPNAHFSGEWASWLAQPVPTPQSHTSVRNCSFTGAVPAASRSVVVQRMALVHGAGQSRRQRPVEAFVQDRDADRLDVPDARGEGTSGSEAWPAPLRWSTGNGPLKRQVT